MASKIQADELLKGILEEKGAEAAKDLVKRLRRETGVDIAFTVLPKRRKRKHRWGTARGKVVAVRFTDSQYQHLTERASKQGKSVGDFVKWLCTRSHHKERG
jgi:predicted nucleotidyltransferase